MAGKFKKWPYPKQCPECSGALYDESFGDTPYTCKLLGNDGNSAAFGNPNAPIICRDYRKGKMTLAEGMNARLGFKSKAKSDGGKVFEGAGQILRSASNDRPLSADELVGGGVKIVAGVGGLVVKGIAKGIKYAEQKEREAAEKAARLLIENSWETINNASFSNTKKTTDEIEELFNIFDRIYYASYETVGLENKEAIADACLKKLDEGIGVYHDAFDSNAIKKDEFQIKLQKSKIKRLDIKDYSVSEDAKAVFYNKNMTILNSVSLDGGTKLVTKSLDLLLSIKSSLFSFMSLIPIKSSFFSSVTRFPIKIQSFFVPERR